MLVSNLALSKLKRIGLIKFWGCPFCCQKGFTLIEVLVVVAILGVLAAVVVPNVGRFINDGQDESYKAELHNIQQAVAAMLAESKAGLLHEYYADTDDMSKVKTKLKDADDNFLFLSSYLTGLDADGKVTSGCTYSFGIDGNVTQTTP